MSAISYMSEDPDTLEPFSFTKKPIDTFIPSHSTISEILPTTSNNSNPQQASNGSRSSNQPESKLDPILNEIDYDEQIRAPRFTLKDQPIDPNPHNFSLNNLFSTNEQTQSQQEQPLKPSGLEIHENDEPQYIPANFDLNKNYTYSYSSVELAENSSTNNLAGMENSTNNYTLTSNNLNTNNHLNSNNQNKNANFVDAINNLNENMTTEERSNSTATTGTVNSTVSASSTATSSNSNLHNNKFVKPVYNFKRPLSIPAVLRPINDYNANVNGGSSRSSQVPSSETSINSSPSLGFKIDLSGRNPDWNNENHDNPDGSGRRDLSFSSFDPLVMSNNEELLKYFEPIEPTHNHWKPNNFTNCCMKCFNNFGNFFNRKRRHHCRFCGFIICSNCLFNDNINDIIKLTRTRAQKHSLLVQESTSSAFTWFPGTKSSTSQESDDDSFNFNLIYLDAHARFVIPIFKKFYALHLPIKSLNKFFKLNKVCKNCGDNYLNLLINLNNTITPSYGSGTKPSGGSADTNTSPTFESDLKVNIDTLNLPFVFIENPFLNTKVTSQNGNSERRNSIINSNDWNWSSF